MTKIIDLPEDYLPSIDELPGELPRIARVVERYFPGLGVKVALVLAEAYPGQPLYLHNVKGLKRRVRDDAVRAKYDQGAKVKELATQTGLSTRHIERILACASSGKKLEEKQLRLFG